LIIDDRAGRAAASKLNLPITGVIGLLLQAKETQFIPELKPLIIEIRQRGYWLSDKLVVEAILLAGEE
jgi:predicted nucleic acid-binding protein